MLSMGWFAMANNMMELSLIRNNLSWPICVSLKNHQSYNFKPFAFTNISRKIKNSHIHSFILKMFTVTGTGQDQSRESVSQPRPPILLLNELIFPWLENLLLDFLETRQLKPPKKNGFRTQKFTCRVHTFPYMELNREKGPCKIKWHNSHSSHSGEITVAIGKWDLRHSASRSESQSSEGQRASEDVSAKLGLALPEEELSYSTQRN